MKVLVAGWFSFPDGLSTAGDVRTAELLRAWLTRAGHACDLALAPPYRGGVDWATADPAAYSHVFFACGPFAQNPSEVKFLDRFSTCRLVGVNLSMRAPLEKWNPFDVLFERDSSVRARPDLSFGAPPSRVPVVGVCLVEAYGYPPGSVDEANGAIARLLASREVAPVPIDTRLDENTLGQCSPGEIEALLGRMDAVVTTRLHGMVLSLKNGVPAVAIDPVMGGGKIRRQAEAIGWTSVLTLEALTDDALRSAFERCLTPEARDEARNCAARARKAVEEVHDQLLQALGEGGPADRNRPSLDYVRGKAKTLGPLARRPADAPTVPAFREVVFQRRRNLDLRPGS